MSAISSPLVTRMAEPSQRLWAHAVNVATLFATKLRTSTFARFLVAGIFNTIFGFAAYGLAVVAGAAIWLALLISVIAGVAFNFMTLGGYAFRQLSLGRLPKFVACYALVYGINLGLIKLLSRWMDGAILAQFLLMFPMAALSYLLMRSFVFSTTRS